MAAVILIATARDQASLELSPLDANFFRATLRSRGVDGTARVSTYMANGLAALFQGFADDWRGWEGVRAWRSLEGELTISATSDKTGHVYLDVRLREGAPALWTLDAQLVLEAGMLDDLAR